MKRVHPLSDSEIAALERLHRRTENADVRSRCDMILWSNEGLSPPQIAERVRFSHDTVSRYIARYESEGVSCHGLALGDHERLRPSTRRSC